MRYSIVHQGLPIATFDATGPDVGSVMVQTLAGFDTVRAVLPSLWNDANGITSSLGRPPGGHAALRQSLELSDERGNFVPTSRIDLCIAGPTVAAALIVLDEAPASVQATVLTRPQSSSAADEV